MGDIRVPSIQMGINYFNTTIPNKFQETNYCFAEENKVFISKQGKGGKSMIGVRLTISRHHWLWDNFPYLSNNYQFFSSIGFLQWVSHSIKNEKQIAQNWNYPGNREGGNKEKHLFNLVWSVQHSIREVLSQTQTLEKLQYTSFISFAYWSSNHFKRKRGWAPLSF